MIELIDKLNEGYLGLVITLSVYSQNNEDLNKEIEDLQKFHYKKARRWQIRKR